MEYIILKLKNTYIRYMRVVKSLKYALPFILPILFIAGISFGAWLNFGVVIFAFGFIPLMELLIKPNAENLDAVELEMRREDRSYDYILYLVVPMVYGCIALYFYNLIFRNPTFLEIVGTTISLGIILGGIGINVAHELGHRNTRFEQILAKLLLLPCAYLHFFIEHNRGHHKNVSTPEDPASSRMNETLYQFWIRSLTYSYISAWKIENKDLTRKKMPVWSFKNEMLRFQIYQMFFWGVLLLLFGWKNTLFYTGAAVIGFLLLETVNYIEHYGLRREKISEFRYEKVNPIHSWNSNHVVGRMMLFELSRHSDHHFKPQKKYQILAHHDQSNQMPTGYPGMMLLSMFPPVWFSVMNPKIENKTPQVSSQMI